MSKVGKHDPHHVMPLKVYFTVFITLLVMTAITIFVSHLNLGEASIYPAMAVAIFKAFLVSYFFMHLKYDYRFNSLVFITSILFLGVFIIFTMTDLMTRGDVLPIQNNFALHDELAYAENKTVSELLSPNLKPSEEHNENTAHAEEQKSTTKLGEAGFKQHCSICHALDKKLIGPPLTEIVKSFNGNPRGIFKQVRNPKKIRPDYPPMPPISKETLTDEDLMAIANYILHIGGTTTDAAHTSTSTELPKEEKTH